MGGQQADEDGGRLPGDGEIGGHLGTCLELVFFLQGRTNKLVDGCYSFWQGGMFPLLHGILAENGELNVIFANYQQSPCFIQMIL